MKPLNGMYVTIEDNTYENKGNLHRHISEQTPNRIINIEKTSTLLNLVLERKAKSHVAGYYYYGDKHDKNAAPHSRIHVAASAAEAMTGVLFYFLLKCSATSEYTCCIST